VNQNIHKKKNKTKLVFKLASKFECLNV